MTELSTVSATTTMTRRDRFVPHAVAAVLCAVILAPLARPGYVLRYDMVFVPHQPLLWDLVAPAGGLPRAVPEDAVVSLLSLALPGWLLQRIALVATIYAAALGAARLVPARRLLTRVIAAVGYAWSPYLAERLLLGQWGLLLCYAALPWLVLGALRVRERRPGGVARMLVAAGICAITPTGGLIALATTVMLVIRPGSVRRAAWVIVGVGLLNGPWLAAATLTTASGRSDPGGVAAFAARGENWSGPVGALVGTGGVWNALTTPLSRGAVIVPLVTAALFVLAVIGAPSLRSRWSPGAATALAGLAAGAFGVALLGVAPPTADLLGWAVSRIPGAGLLRDGQKLLIPYSLILFTCVALGVERIAARLTAVRARLVLVTAVILPVALMPDLANGGAGRLTPVAYPTDWDTVAAIVGTAPGPVLSLPFSEYRAFAWNGGWTVIDPAPRYLPAEVLSDDTLLVGDLRVEGENPDAARVRDLLAHGLPVAGAATPWVLVAHDAGGSVPDGALIGLETVHKGQFLDLYANPAAGPPRPAQPARRAVVVSVDIMALGLFLAAAWRLRKRATAW